MINDKRLNFLSYQVTLFVGDFVEGVASYQTNKAMHVSIDCNISIAQAIFTWDIICPPKITITQQSNCNRHIMVMVNNQQ